MGANTHRNVDQSHYNSIQQPLKTSTHVGKNSLNLRDIKKPITKKYLLDVLSQYYKGDIEKVSNLNTFIMDNRETVSRESIEHVRHK